MIAELSAKVTAIGKAERAQSGPEDEAMTAAVYYKVLAPDYRPPLQGGAPVWDGVTLPCDLPPVEVDTGSQECGVGWNCVARLREGLVLAGLWPTGHPNPILVVEPRGTVVTRGTKTRSSELRLVRVASETEIKGGMRDLLGPLGETVTARLEDEQWAWYQALGRPGHDREQVQRGLRQALERRGLGTWSLQEFGGGQEFGDARAAWVARDARAARAARAAWAAWAAKVAWDAWDAWDARDTRATWAARAAWVAWDAWDAWDARGARDAWESLLLACAVLIDARPGDPDMLSVGLREAYANGLALALPTGPTQLGWVMET